jgi:hypothetical protein
LQLNTKKPIISTYVPWWSKDEDGSISKYSPDINCCSFPMKYIDFKERHPVLSNFYPDWGDQKAIEHYGIAGHFIFTVGDFADEILPDPLIMFAGEEETIALRAWTRGYRIYAIKNPIAWHKNKGVGILPKNDRTINFGTQEYHQRFVRKNEKSIERVKRYYDLEN